MSSITRKHGQLFHLCKNKSAHQLCSNLLYPKFNPKSLYMYRPVCVGPVWNPEEWFSCFDRGSYISCLLILSETIFYGYINNEMQLGKENPVSPKGFSSSLTNGIPIGHAWTTSQYHIFLFSFLFKKVF